MLDMIPVQLLIIVGPWLCNAVHWQEIVVRKLEGSNRAYREEAATQVTTFNASIGTICANVSSDLTLCWAHHTTFTIILLKLMQGEGETPTPFLIDVNFMCCFFTLYGVTTMNAG